MKKFICTAFLLTIFKLSILAGWYECYNFSGFIDQYPITLSLQIKSEYFGAEKANYNVIGVYKYDKYNIPIYLDGFFDKETNIVTLTEYVGEKENAMLKFNMTDSTTTGEWKKKDNDKNLLLKLNFESKLIDIEQKDFYDEVPILFESYNENYYFEGIYSKTSNEYNATMIKLNIYERKTNKLFQVIDFSRSKIGIGNVKTIIYKNLDAYGDRFYVDIRYDKFGDLICFKFNSNSQIYELEKHENKYIDELINNNGS